VILVGEIRDKETLSTAIGGGSDWKSSVWNFAYKLCGQNR
jgi:hypothetical protein